MLSFKPTYSLSSFTFIKRLFSSCSQFCHKGGVIRISEVIYISPGNLGSNPLTDNLMRLLKFLRYLSCSPLFFPFVDHSLVVARGLGQLSEAMSQAVQGHPRWMDHSEEF